MHSLEVTGEDLLVVSSWNILSGLVLSVNGRILGPGGQIWDFQFQHTPVATRLGTASTFTLSPGRLLNLSVYSIAGVARRGQCYVRLRLQHRKFGTPALMVMLAQGYVTSDGSLLWPGGSYHDSVAGRGFLCSVTGTDPAAGVEVIEAVPTNARWRLRTLRASLVTDVTAPARTVNLIVDDGTTTLLNFPGVTTQAASLTRTYNVAEYGFQPTAVGTDIFFYIPFNLYLFQGWRIRTSTTALAAGDNWGAPQMEVEEWIEE